MKAKSTCLVAFLCFSICCCAQSVQDKMMQRHPDCHDVLINASNVLPELYTAKSFDSMAIAIKVIEQYCNSLSPDIFYTNTLLSIQRSTFSINDFSTNGRFDTLLSTYILTLKEVRDGGYYASRYQYYFFTDAEKKFYAFIKTWATDLLARTTLGSSESFICNVLAGNIKHPEATLKANKTKYPELYSLLQKNYLNERSQTTGVLTFMSGIWLPSGDLKVLGAHPSVGFQLGGRGKTNEFDLIIQVRFLNAAGYYNVSRNDSLYALHHFLGFYLGVDYSHYFLHSTNFEAGVTGGVGYDGFDIADPDKNDHSKDYLKPFTIGSLNLNAGLRVNYFFNPRFHIGLIAKYNGISYNNNNGTNLHGHPVSIDFIIGR